MQARLFKFTELNDTLTPSQQGSQITRQTHDAVYALIHTIQERPNTDSPATAVPSTLLLPTHSSTENALV